MTRDQVTAIIRPLVVEQLGVEEEKVVDNAHFVNDLEADSLDLVELIMTLEEILNERGFQIEISDEEGEKITTVGEAIDFVHSKVNT